eukprot:6200541-Pleurochrysis_carterae.AAC.2
MLNKAKCRLLADALVCTDLHRRLEARTRSRPLLRAVLDSYSSKARARHCFVDAQCTHASARPRLSPCTRIKACKMRTMLCLLQCVNGGRCPWRTFAVSTRPVLTEEETGARTTQRFCSAQIKQIKARCGYGNTLNP